MMSPESEDQGFTFNVGMKSLERQRKQGTVPSPVIRESANIVLYLAWK